MTKFKSVDKVERKEVVCDSTTLLTGIKQWGIYTVDTVCGDDITLAESFKPDFTFPSERFELVEEQDDPLPPAPESGVYYSHNNDRRVTVLLEEGLPEDVIAVGTDASFMKVRLTAETALVLAHDLNRMANEIKRRERAQSGE